VTTHPKAVKIINVATKSKAPCFFMIISLPLTTAKRGGNSHAPHSTPPLTHTPIGLREFADRIANRVNADKVWGERVNRRRFMSIDR
jgi:hypothetical protein